MQNEHMIFTEIGELLTLKGVAQKDGRNVREEDLGVLQRAALVAKDERILWLGLQTDLPAEYCGQASISLHGATVVPGFVECHTHSVFAGDRAEEFEWRQQGQTYPQISARGGGILSTVRATRLASFQDLVRGTQARVDRFVNQGVTTLEIKSGYGLDKETEIKCLKVAAAMVGPRLIKTYLGAHSRSPDHPDLTSYLKQMVEEVLPAVALEKLAERVDIYIEKGFYDLDLGRRYLECARALGFPITAHVEQLSDFGGTELALEFSPQSVDHVVYLSDSAIGKVARSTATAVLLPTSDFYLKMRYPPARSLLDQGARVALSTDFNPGTSPSQDLSLVGVLARLNMQMSQAEVMSALTYGAAAALGKASEVGSLEVGKLCDFAVLGCSWKNLFYSVGEHPVRAVYKGGKQIKKDEKTF